MNIYIGGVWDLLHIGHLNILERAKGLGGKLFVGVGTDDFDNYYKAHPIFRPYVERARLVAALKCVDQIIPFSRPGAFWMLNKYKIDIVVVDSEWGKLVEQKKQKEYIVRTGRKLVVFPYTKGISTSILQKEISKTFHRKGEKKSSV